MPQNGRFLSGGEITAPIGFEAAGIAAGIKADGALDVAVVHSERPCAAAALFTTNAFQAAPVLYDRAALGRQSPDAPPTAGKAVVINAGCANACTGRQGLRDAEATAAEAGALLGLSADDVLVMSTGVIGQPLPMDKLLTGVRAAVGALASGPDAGHAAARAIMTTDTRPKEAALRVSGPEGAYTIAGMAKGAGMIHPNMATLLVLVTTDAALTPALARTALEACVADSFHAITVDGDTSTNDTLMLLANGGAGHPPLVAGTPAYSAFVSGLGELLRYLAREVVRDGEGATHLVAVEVTGASDDADAHLAAMAVARSLLVKTAIYGQDANWGRIVCAVGYSGATVDPDRTRVWLGDLELVRDGAPYDVNEERAAEILAEAEIAIRVDLGLGQGRARVWTCDLSHGYVDINAHYRT